VEDILHLEKRWSKLPGASAGSVALEDVTALLGAEVLAVSLPIFFGAFLQHAYMHTALFSKLQCIFIENWHWIEP
jgi:hypothetical protein